jgi:Flp pilus assembly protein TadG
MFTRNEPARTLHTWRRRLLALGKGFVSGCRSAFSAATCQLRLPTALELAEKRRNQRLEALNSPGFKPCSFKTPNAESFSESSLAAEVEESHSSGLSQTLGKKLNISTRNATRASPPQLGKCSCRFRSTEAAALIEFAVALPLLVVLVVGIFDFGGAFNLKQELNNAVREGARFGAAQPTNDLALAQPPSVNAVRYVVDSYLQTAHINDCGLNSDTTTTWAFAGGNLDWHFTASGNGCSMTLDVTRAVPVQETIVGQPSVNMLATTVSISYPYRWHFNSVIQLLVPGANYGLTNITSDATAVNAD